MKTNINVLNDNTGELIHQCSPLHQDKKIMACSMQYRYKYSM